MFVGTCRVTLHIAMSQSLKDKRQVVRSVLQRLRNQFEIAAAEVDAQDLRQLAVLGLASVSGDAAHAEEILEHAVRYIEASRPDVEITDVRLDMVSVEA
ncbi:MAG TPA: DUF503 domain-containing protein [Ktedonobacterales bacterium]|nr:DUF503 domain-containing protein [Ktedonobacterales bacterium]